MSEIAQMTEMPQVAPKCKIDTCTKLCTWSPRLHRFTKSCCLKHQLQYVKQLIQEARQEGFENLSKGIRY